MKSLKNLTGDSLEQLIDYKVVDQNGEEIGSLHSLWSDASTGGVEFLGVKTGWIFGHNHVVPAEKAELDEAGNVIRLPYTQAFIKEATSISADSEISEEEENNIYKYYGMDARPTTDPGATETEGSGASTYGGTATSGVPEAAGAAALAGVGGTTQGAEQAGEPSTEGAAARWRRTSRAGAGPGAGAGTESAGDAVRAAVDDLSPTDPSGTRTPPGTVPSTYGTSNLYGSTGTSTPPVESDDLGA